MPAADEPSPEGGSRTGLIIGIVAAVLAAVGVGAFFLTRDGDDDDVATPTVPTVPEFTVPEFTISEITIPEITIPEITIPEITIPEITIPNITIPNITIPDLSLPNITLPDLSLPDLSIPEIGGEVPPPTEEPDGLGDDPELDALANDCYDGDMEACDDLFRDSDLGSDYERYGDTCAGRQPADTLVFCAVRFSG